MFFVLFFLIQEIEALQEIINQLLDRGYTSHCCRLAAEFGVYNKNLAIVVVCFYQERPHLSLAVKVTITILERMVVLFLQIYEFIYYNSS